MTNYVQDLNFLSEFALNKQGMVKEAITEFNIIRLAITQQLQLTNDYKEMCDRIMVMPLRKLLLENQQDSVLLQLCPSFKMPPTKGIPYLGEDKLKIELPPYIFGDQGEWIPLSDWCQQIIASFDKTELDVPNAIPQDTFANIKNKLKNGDKIIFEAYFILDNVIYKEETSQMYVRKNPEDVQERADIFRLMDKAGYYKLTVYDYIKHLSDKRGAHIDTAMAPMISMINCSKKAINTPTVWFALQMIYAAKKQIPELSDYWPEMDEIIDRYHDPNGK